MSAPSMRTAADLEAELAACVAGMSPSLELTEEQRADLASRYLGESNLDPGPKSAASRRHGKSRVVVDAILDLFHVRYPEMSLSTRQCFYQLAQVYRVVDKDKKGYRQARRLLVEMRRSGELDDERIVDRTRVIHQLAVWEGPEELTRAAARQFRRDLWTTQPVIPLVGCEKQALEAIFIDAVDVYGANLFINHGYASEHYYLDWAKQIREYYDHGKRTAVLFFADFDPSGCNAEEVLLRHVGRHLEKMGIRPDDALECWTRVGLTYEDIMAPGFYRLPVNRKDKRAPKYIARYGEEVGELDALAPPALRLLIQGAIREHVTDQDAWCRLQNVERVQRESLDIVAGNWDAALRGAKRGKK